MFTYKNIDGIDYQILVEADFLVNLYEDGCFDEQTSENKDGLHNTTIQKAMDNIFKTKTGISICKDIFGV